MKISIITKQQDLLKRPLAGDILKDADGTINIQIQELNNDDYEFLLAIHCLIENKLIEKRKIKITDIEDFEKSYYSNSKISGSQDDPGDEPDSPYHKEHIFATYIEMLIAKELNLSWKSCR
ncbi:MAG: hypothetical protein EHM58_00420 [Ignavibacteriae bacterium]|nr:MAG: hypothetical protein EHM58_00420 [Ignavibacteriota bacterium]